MIRFISIVSVIFLVGCATYRESRKQDLFEIASHAYEQTLLWGRYSVANSFRKVQATDRQVVNLEKLRKIKVTSYELLDKTISEDRSRVHQTVEIKYYNIERMLETTLVDKQVWEYDPEDKGWYLLSGLPDFK
jgi:hypothetical protein